MRITCEHCGCGIDIEKNKNCPNCGAPYSNSKDYKEYKETHKKSKDYDFREREADIRTKELGNQIIEKTLNTQKKFSIIPVIFIIIFIAAFAFIAYNIFKFQKPAINTNTNPVTVSFNETASSSSFDIKCDDITKYKLDIYEEKVKPNDIDYYNFHIIFTNKSTTWHTLSDISLTYTDDKGNENIVANKHDQNLEEMRKGLTYIAQDELSYSGNVTFEIPEYVKDVKIVYKKTTIKIDNFRDYIK